MFQDHFSGHADLYARFRPRYPRPLFEWLAGIAPGRDLAIDCATGNGQAAVLLGERFRHVVACDASGTQVAAAEESSAVGYAVALAEALPVGAAQADVLTVAQALHWFDLPRFYDEARRVLRPRGVLAAWIYGRARISDGIDPIVKYFYRDVVGPYWPDERAHIDSKYAGITLPFPRLEPPDLVIEEDWTAGQFLGYLGTWSAVQRYRSARGEDPLPLIERDFREAFGPGTRRVTWRLTLIAGVNE